MSVLQRAPGGGSSRYDALLLFALAALFFVLTGAEPMWEGDSAQYTTIAVTGDILNIPSHATYLAAGWLSTSLLPGDHILAMRLLSWGFGALGVAAVYLIVRYYTGSRVGSWLAGLVLMTAGEYWHLSTVIEVYAVQSGALLLAFALWLYAEPRAGLPDAAFWHSRRAWAGMIGAGLLLAFAGLVSPASLAFLPMFLLGRDLHIPRRWLVIGAVAVLGVGALSAVILAGPLLRGRAINFDTSFFLRNVTYTALSLGLVTLATLVMAGLSQLRVPDDPAATRRLRRFMLAVTLTVIVHLPFGLFIAIGPLLPIYGLLAAAFGVMLAWFVPQIGLSRTAARRLGIVLLVVVILAGVGGVVGCQLQPDFCGWFGEQWTEHQGDLLPMLLASALVPVGLVITWAIRRGNPAFDRSYLLRGGLVVVASLIIGRYLVLEPRQTIATDLRAAIDILREIDPPTEQIVGGFPELMIYDYYDLGYAPWPSEHLYAEDLTPERFDAGIDEYGGMYVMGLWIWDDLARRGIQQEEYTLTSLDGDKALWLVQHAATSTP
ncbi:MAG: phospholipid carrier-dependent glycosyltransferase [Anaerolineae bacterium]|nr:phospholipid carrier-dependent glycosyltransferase [Anaerolineae bacterium]